MSIQPIGPQIPLIDVQKTVPAPAAAPVQQPEQEPAPKAPVYDEYLPEDQAARQPSGLYEIVPDEEGHPVVHFDDPEKADRPESGSERTTTDTGRVDRELEQLRKRAQELQKQVSQAADPTQAERLSKQLRQVENELRQKDNDTYRRQHAVIS